MNEYGVLSFRKRFYNFRPVPFPLSTNDILIAPFWADIYRFSGGNIYYRLTKDESLVNQTAQDIREAFEDDFIPTSLVIATWDKVQEFGSFGGEVRFKVVLHTVELMKTHLTFFSKHQIILKA